MRPIGNHFSNTLPTKMFNKRNASRLLAQVEVQSHLAITNDKNKPIHVHYSQVFIIVKKTKESWPKRVKEGYCFFFQSFAQAHQ